MRRKVSFDRPGKASEPTVLQKALVAVPDGYGYYRSVAVMQHYLQNSDCKSDSNAHWYGQNCCLSAVVRPRCC